VRNEHKMAIRYYNKVITKDSNDRNILVTKGNELFDKKKYSEAKHYYKMAIL